VQGRRYKVYKLSKPYILRNLQKKNGKLSLDTTRTEFIFNSSANIPISEQENHVCVDRQTDKTQICCSHSNWITKLKKNPSFECTKIVYNDSYRILELTGEFPKDIVTLRRIV